VAGWVYAYATRTRPQKKLLGENNRSSRWYVLFWNQGYFDQIYDAYLVTPTTRLAHWLWKTIDVRVIDKSIYFMANYSVYFARWLWRIVDIRWLERTVGQVFRQVNNDRQLRQVIAFRTLQHQVLVIIFWLVGLTGLLYYLI
jgi:NADH:ubiquinone oxidoreductase subunit 5 (subunit L)/multisubunit Na+/H+ antiporter MnhA subunit